MARKEITKNIPERTIVQKATVKSYMVVTCDICNLEIEKHQRHRVCSLCKRDVHGIKCSEYDPEEYGDYPAIFCIICYNLKFVKYQQEREELYKTIDKLEQQLENKIKKESLSESTIS